MIRGFRTFEELREHFPELQMNSQMRNENVYVCLALPGTGEFLELHKQRRCVKCTGSMNVVAHDLNETCGVMMLRCSSCLEDEFLFITRERTTSADVCVFQMAPKLKTTRSLFDGFKCLSCKRELEGITVDTAAYDIKTIVATHLRCGHCGECMNIVFWDPPRNYFAYSIQLGDSVRMASAYAALVFYVSALENYLQKSFLAASSFNKFLVLTRRVSFQNLHEASALFKQYFNLELPKIAGDRWEIMMGAVKKRNMIIHNAGHDKAFNRIDVDDHAVETIRTAIHGFVDDALRPELRKMNVD